MQPDGLTLPNGLRDDGTDSTTRSRLVTVLQFLRNSRLPSLGSLVLLYVSMVLLDLANRTVADAGLGAIVIVAGYGVFLGFMIIGKPSHLAAYAACGFLALFSYATIAGQPVALILTITTSKTVGVVLAAAILRQRLGQSTDLTRPGVMLYFVCVAMIMMPALPASAISLVRWLNQQDPLWAILPGVYLANALGCAIAAPLVLSIHRDELRTALEPGRRLTSVLALLALVVGTTVVFAQNRFPILFAVMPLMLMVVLRLGMAGASLGAALVTVIATAMTFLGLGPFQLLSGAQLPKVLLLQAFLVTICVQSYPLAALVHARRKLELGLIVRETRARFAEAKLRLSEELHRALTENASDIVSRFSLEGRRLYVSPSVQDILGFRPNELTGKEGLGRVHPDDREAYMAVGDQMRDGVERIEIVYRHARADGSWAWLEARLRMVRNIAREPAEYISNARDITRQKETEAKLADAMAELSILATTDGLTGIANRRRFDDTMRKEWRRAMRAGTPVAVIMVDADHFKLYNDTYGHQEGDNCLRVLAAALSSCTKRPGDMAARYGGEEFAVILPGTTVSGAANIGERIREAVLAQNRPHIRNASGIVTVSVGVASMVPERHGRIEALLAAADEALYEAKRQGRNRVVAHAEIIATSVAGSELAEADASHNIIQLRDAGVRSAG